MSETDEKAGGGAAGAEAGARESGSTGEGEAGGQVDEAAQLRAEEESAKAMEAEVPHPTGYEDPGQEPPAGAGKA